MASKSTYRPDIDGLRALAVILVVFYHYGIGPSGGFIGVDVFFVISGFVITKNLCLHLETGTFSFSGFYERRIRRIAPALLLVVTISLLAGGILMMPREFEAVGSQAVSAVFGVSNIYFLNNTGYFDGRADLMPLLHTWSLGVEEQFYLVWPLIIVVFWRTAMGKPRLMLGLLCSVALASFIGSVWLVGVDQSQTFYMPYTRAWELAIGAIAACAPAIRSRLVSAALPIVGVAAICWAGLALDRNDLFPGHNALLPCLGATLIVWPKAKNLPSALIGLPQAAAIGKLSYSIYLWHWPLLVFWKVFTASTTILPWDAVGLLAATLLLAWLTFETVENPFRTQKLSRPQIFSAGFLSSIAVAGCALFILLTQGLPQRLPAEAQRLAAFSREPSLIDGPGFCAASLKFVTYSAQNECLAPDPDRRNVLILGDSQAQHFIAALEIHFPDTNFLNVTEYECKPLFVRLQSDLDERCTRAFDSLLTYLRGGVKYDAIVLSAQWGNPNSEDLSETVRILSDYANDVIVFGPTLQSWSSGNVPQFLAAGHLPRHPRVTRVFSSNFDDALEADTSMSAAISGVGTYYSPLAVMCPEGEESCRLMTPDGSVVIKDENHLTFAGSNYIINGLIRSGLRL